MRIPLCAKDRRKEGGPKWLRRIKAHESGTNKTPKNVDEYIATAPVEARSKLEEVRAAIREVAPAAHESIYYRIPYYSYKGQLAWFGLQNGYVGLYLRPPVIEEHKDDLEGYKTTKSAVHLPLKEKIPVRLVKKLVRARVKKNEAEA